MVVILNQEMRIFGHPPKLSREDQLLMTLIRTQFHIGQTYDLSESTVCRTINKVENALIQPGQFTLPGKKKLQRNDTFIEIILVDVTEQAIERPKKNKNYTIVASKRVIHKKHK